jgi:photosystem II stability/assembly factor-like uncharacterized protein
MTEVRLDAMLSEFVPRRMYAGISAAGTFRSDDGGEHWTVLNSGVRADFLPNKLPEVGQCVHKVVMDSADPATLYRQDHCGIYASHDRAESWKRVGGSLPDDFGMAVASAPPLPGSAFFVPMTGETRLIPGGRIQVHRWSDRARKWTALERGNPWPRDYGTHREGLATDSMGPAGIYLGTTTGQLFWSADGGARWDKMPYQFLAIHSVEVSGPSTGR